MRRKQCEKCSGGCYQYVKGVIITDRCHRYATVNANGYPVGIKPCMYITECELANNGKGGSDTQAIKNQSRQPRTFNMQKGGET